MRILRFAGLLIEAATLAYWALSGAHRGWSQNQVPVKQLDVVTGLDIITYEDRFVPGIDVLVLGMVLGGGLFALSFLWRAPKQPPSKRAA